MKNLLTSLILFTCIAHSHAQKDSSAKCKARIFSISAELGVPPWLSMQQVKQSDYQSLVPNNEMLNADYSGFKSSPGYAFMNPGFQGMPGIKVYADLGGKKYRKEIYFGLSFSKEYVSGISYNRESYDTIGVFIDPANNKTLYDIVSINDYYNFSIVSNRWMIPLGFNFTSNQDKFFWISLGLQIAPSISTNYKFVSGHTQNTIEYLLEPGEEVKYGNGYQKSNHIGFSAKQTSSSLSGLGFGLYVSAPVSVYMHPFKRAKFLKHLNPMISASPYFGLAKHKYSNMLSGFGTIVSAGLRYNW
ncbi:MAG: hypothetical protein JNL60_02960 [Bacteroidia bacterium]|nr:hypothetical protein [Bacteroidia bacterium]